MVFPANETYLCVADFAVIDGPIIVDVTEAAREELQKHFGGGCNNTGIEY